MIISHICTRNSGKRYELVELLRQLCTKYNIPFFELMIYLKDKNPSEIFEKPEEVFHYTTQGHIR